MPDSRSRHEQRAGFEHEVRITLLEHDADEREASDRAARRANIALVVVMFTATVTFAAAAVMLALNLATGKP